jgi:hypothetical protein
MSPSAPANPYGPDLGARDPIAAMGETPGKIRAVVSSWTPAQFERSYAPGKWSARLILIHLAQSELALGNRARMALTSPNYAAQPFNQDEWLKKENRLSGPEALQVFTALAAMNRSFFASLSAADRAVTLSHPEYGTLTVDWIGVQIAGHQLHHLEQFRQIADK